MALAFCNDLDGETRIASLIERGADPNLPNALVNFQTYTTVAQRTQPLELLIKAGMRLNDVYTIEPALMPTHREGPITLLDFALDIEAYLNTRSKAFQRLVQKHAGPMTGRRSFIAETIPNSRDHGAVSAPEAGALPARN